MNALVAFEASARLLSFTRAADELNVSREAVSRHIRILEDHLGAQLFQRLHRSIGLTPAGKQFAAVVARGLANIAAAAETAGGSTTQRISVTATVAIASFWLTPRLPAFRRAHPDAELRVTVSDTPRDMLAEAIDIGLRYGDGDWRGLDAVRLFDIRSTPVCAPGYLDTAPPLESVGDLANHVLLNLDGAAHAAEDWHWWLEGMDVLGASTMRTTGFDNYANVIQAAMDGQGVALGFSGIVEGLVRSGQLIHPLDTHLSKGLAVYLVTPRDATLSPIAARFRDWVTAEAAVPSQTPTSP